MNNRIKGTSGSFGAGMGSRRKALAQVQGTASERMPTSARPDQVAINPLNPRQFFDPVRREELAQSIRAVGQLQPAAVMTRDAFLEAVPEHADSIGSAEYVVLAGSTRLLAARDAEVEEFFFHVNNRPQAREEIIEVALLENVQRVDLTPLEEAETLQGLCEVYGTQEAVAERLSRSQGWVSQRISLLNLVPKVQGDLNDGRLTVREARRLARLSSEEQEQAREQEYYPVIRTPGAESPSAEYYPVIPVPEDQDSKSPTSEAEVEADEVSAGRTSSPVNQVYNGSGVEGPSVPPPSREQRRDSAGHNDDQADPVQLTLDLEWEPKTTAEEIVSAYGQERAAQIADAIIARL